MIPFSGHTLQMHPLQNCGQNDINFMHFNSLKPLLKRLFTKTQNSENNYKTMIVLKLFKVNRLLLFGDFCNVCRVSGIHKSRSDTEPLSLRTGLHPKACSHNVTVTYQPQ